MIFFLLYKKKQKGNTSTPKMMPKYTTSVSQNSLENRKPLNSTSSDRDSLQSQQSTVLSRNYDNKFIIAIDWDPTALHLRYQNTFERVSYWKYTVR